HRGPEARLAEITADAILGLQRLPEAARAVEKAAITLSEGRLSLDLRHSARPRWPIWLAITVAAALSLIAILN
ncbi:MAG: hypothetical protein VW713_11175, partial [Alphaproteobacteria bacterium]